MRRPTNIFLIGPMGAGKSTIGRQLAKDLKMDFYDSDQEIETKAGADVGWIFDVEGEAGFQQREANVLEELTQRQTIVLATGGGAVLLPENRQRLAARGTVVYLLTTIDQQLKRTMRDKKRPEPLIRELHQAPREELEAVMQARDPLYREIADFVIATDGKTVRAVANEIIEWLDNEER